MSINVAKLFATMGFSIDTTDVTKVNNVINSVKTSSNELSRKLFVMNNHLQKSQGYLSKIAKADGTGKAIGNMGTRYVNLAKSVDTARTSTSKFGRLLTIIEPRLESTGNKLDALTLKWKGLNDVIKEANTNLSQVSSRVPRSPAQAHLGIRNGRYVGQGGSGYTQGGYVGQQRYSSKDKSFLQEALSGIPLMLNPFTPSGMLAGGAVTAGVALKETVSAGRERIKSQNVMLMAAEDQNQYAKSLEFVRKESHRLGQDTTEMGMAFGKVLQSAKGKMDFKEVQNTFTAFGEMMVAMGSNVEDQKGVYRALTQMLSKGKIEAEEEGQMAERGLPAKELVKKAAMATYGVDEDKYQSMRQKGQVKFEDIAPELNKMLREMANNNDALQNHLNTSMTAQARFMNTLKDGAEALMKAGLDDFLKMTFNGLTAIMPHLLTFTKGLLGAAKGVTTLVGSIGKFVSDNPKSLLAVSAISTAIALLASRTGFAALTFARFGLGVTGALAMIGKAMRRILPLFVLMTVFEGYDSYMKGNDNWMARFVDWLQILYLEVDLFVSKLQLAFMDIKNLEMPKWRVDIDANGIGIESQLAPKGDTTLGRTYNLATGMLGGIKELGRRWLTPQDNNKENKKPWSVPQPIWDMHNPPQNSSSRVTPTEGTVKLIIDNGTNTSEVNIPLNARSEQTFKMSLGGTGYIV